MTGLLATQNRQWNSLQRRASQISNKTTLSLIFSKNVTTQLEQRFFSFHQKRLLYLNYHEEKVLKTTTLSMSKLLIKWNPLQTISMKCHVDANLLRDKLVKLTTTCTIAHFSRTQPNYT